MAQRFQVRTSIGEAELAELDRRRGLATRTTYIRWMLREALGSTSTPLTPKPPPPRREPRERLLDHAGQDCDHPPVRVLKGLCGACGQAVTG